MIANRQDSALLEQSFRAGATDFVARPIIETEIRARAHSALTIKRVIDQRRQRESELIELTRLLEETNERLRHLSALDALTGIANRRRMMAFLDQEWRRAARDGAPLSVLMIDVDHFKAFNDANGHQGGDDCLWLVANCLKRCLNRPADMVGRYGGEEFIAVLPETHPDGAGGVGEAMRAGIGALGILHPQAPTAPHVTVSVGVASCLPDRGMTASRLISAADRALYEAKRSGRNKVVVYNPDLDGGASPLPARTPIDRTT